MKKVIIIALLHLLINRAFAFDLTRVVGGRAAAMGRTAVCERGLWGLQNNPAGIAMLQGWQLGVYYENQWLLRETAFKSAGVVRSIQGIGCFGLSVSQFGGARYSENKFGIAYARDFGPYLQMGLQLDYMLFHWGEGYGSRGAMSFELGVQSQVTERLRLGAYLFNPVQTKLSTAWGDRLPVVLRFGMAYRLMDGFVGQCEVEKDSQREGVQLRAGFEYVVFDRFSLRAGAQYNPYILSFGVGYEFWRIRVDIGAQMHQVLGYSVQVGMRYEG